MSKEIKLTKAQVTEIETMAATMTQEQIAHALGFSGRTFRRMLKRDTVLMSAYKKGRAKGVLAVSGALYERALAGDVPSMIFYLKTQAGWTERQQVELTTEAPKSFSDLYSDLKAKRYCKS